MTCFWTQGHWVYSNLSSPKLSEVNNKSRIVRKTQTEQKNLSVSNFIKLPLKQLEIRKFKKKRELQAYEEFLWLSNSFILKRQTCVQLKFSSRENMSLINCLSKVSKVSHHSNLISNQSQRCIVIWCFDTFLMIPK